MLVHLYVFQDIFIPFQKKLHLKSRTRGGKWGMGPQSLLQYMVHSKFTGVWMNQWVGVRGWKRFLVFIVYLLELLEFFYFFYVYIIAFVIKLKHIKMCYLLLGICQFAFSVSSTSEAFPFSFASTAFLQKVQIKGHLCAAIYSFLFWIQGFLTLYVPPWVLIPLCSVGPFFPAWWVRALWPGRVWFIQLSPKISNHWPYCSEKGGKCGTTFLPNC